MAQQPTVNEIRSNIETTKQQVNETTKQLQSRINDLKDWRSTVNQYPLISLAAAIGAGVLLGGFAKPLVKAGWKSTKATAKGAIMARAMQVARSRFA